MRHAPFHQWVVLALVWPSLICQAESVTPLFHDDYENVAVAEAPKPDVGSYALQEGTVVAAGQGVNSLGKTHPSSPLEGDKLFLLDAPAETGRRNIANLAAPATGDGTLRFEVDLMLIDSSYLQFGLGSDDGGKAISGQVLTVVISLMADGKLCVYNGKKHTPIPGLKHALGQWQHYTIEYKPGESQYVLAAGNVRTTLNAFVGDMTRVAQINRVFVNTGGSSTIGYSDNLTATFTRADDAQP
ncbi:MAG: hypothetical protein IT445_20455 [Phycisphaeraceae bacterium]|nr:hypothetical protein [Phycisphaeraceae bacterium]